MDKPLFDSDVDPKRIKNTADGLRRQGEFESARMLDGYADILEAQEKAVPVMVVNHVSSAEHDLPIGMKLYTHPSPSDAERLADRIMKIIHPHLDTGDSRTAADWAVEIYHAICIHFGEAQPPAASVPDGCTESNCARCNTHPDHRGDMQHAGIGSYPVGSTQDQPQAQTDGLHMVTAEEDAAASSVASRWRYSQPRTQENPNG